MKPTRRSVGRHAPLLSSPRPLPSRAGSRPVIRLVSALAFLVAACASLHASAQERIPETSPAYGPAVTAEAPPSARLNTPNESTFFRRTGYTTLGTLLGAGITVGATFVGGSLAGSTGCGNEGFGCAVQGALGAAGGLFIGYPAVPLGAYGGAKLGGSRTRWWVSTLASGVALVQLVYGTREIVDSPSLNSGQRKALLLTNAAFSMFWPIAMMEWSHQRQVRRAVPRARVQLEPNGLGVRGRF